MDVPSRMQHLQPFEQLIRDFLYLSFIQRICSLIDKRPQITLSQFHDNLRMEFLFNNIVHFQYIWMLRQIIEYLQFTLDIGRRRVHFLDGDCLCRDLLCRVKVLVLVDSAECAFRHFADTFIVLHDISEIVIYEYSNLTIRFYI